MRFISLIPLSLLTFATAALAFPSLASRHYKVQDGHTVPSTQDQPARPSVTQSPSQAGIQSCLHSSQKARKFVLPDPIANFTSKIIPDDDHPYRAPCQYDRRGPCPALNTLANHGYIPRNGVTTTEQIIQGCMEGFGMARDLTRGNANTAMLSIGDADELVPPLPGCIDGPISGGLSKAGRIEGDVSLTRLDASEGSGSRFNPGLFDQLLLFVGKFGDNSPGQDTRLNSEVFTQLLRSRFNFEKANDPKLSYRVGRQLISLAATALILELFPSFPNGVNANLTVPELSSFFRDERFPENWVRRAPPAGLPEIVPTAGIFAKAITMDPPSDTVVSPGRNINGTYVQDPPFQNILCEGYMATVETDIPAIFNKQTGILKENVDTMLAAMLKPFADIANCTAAVPNGQAGV
ncbi:Cloroperoxidase [Exidia glandulosa HHB12029]|uniref:Cloroperoxidase n=1 Tax=Exidia glandulosa HHB12029 TaxID=1314781 RepID=A0A165EMX7_EXIGL|nr:Cloroperoxidase [Exidia glandulosa HHB12029]